MKEKGKILKLSITASMAASLLALSGCAAIGTAIKHRNLEVNSKMSDTIFLDPVPQSEKTIYIQVRSTLSEDETNALFWVFIKNKGNHQQKQTVFIGYPKHKQVKSIRN
ncbi:complement resistance protein TraT [Fastidiosibacter lacustris]|uniref:complement resistance protein TraT n=1 Tax=Fastidiosibacter lacustris TaxID=2056695 RepID=UPI000E34D397|nr:complement resistance protein TraT [Fastidiosibacter lacustris]